MFNGNWVDLVIILLTLFFVFEALRVGFWVMLVDFIAFFSSLLIALRGYGYASVFLKANFSLSRSLSNAFGFLLTSIFDEAILGTLLAKLISKLPEKKANFKGHKILATIPAIGEALVLTAFIIFLILSFPLSPKIKSDVSSSRIGGFLMEKTSGVEAGLADIFGGVIEDSLTYLTINPESTKRIDLQVETQELKVDEVSEKELFDLTNKEREKEGVVKLVWEPKLLTVARNHASDMWSRKYFSHYSLEGEDVGDRIEKIDYRYGLAGENLALAPTVSSAHTGLMNSEGHRRNILDKRFTKMAIGVVDNGIYGKMFVQVFIDQ